MKGKSLKLNFVMNAILTMSSIIFPLITFRYVSNILLPDGTGKVSFAISLITYFNMFAQLGIPIYGIRICAMVRDNKEELTRTAHELLVLNFIVGAVSYFVLLLAILFVPKLQEDRALYIIVSSTIFLSAIGMEWLYKALEQYTYIAIRSIIFKLIAMVGMFLLIHQKSDYVWRHHRICIQCCKYHQFVSCAKVHRFSLSRILQHTPSFKTGADLFRHVLCHDNLY